jgi:hypothetical protein
MRILFFFFHNYFFPGEITDELVPMKVLRKESNRMCGFTTPRSLKINNHKQVSTKHCQVWQIIKAFK